MADTVVEALINDYLSVLTGRGNTVAVFENRLKSFATILGELNNREHYSLLASFSKKQAFDGGSI